MREKKLPKFNYYDEFIKNIEIALEMSQILKDFIDNYDNNKAKEIEQTVHNLENKADDNLHHLLETLVKDFLPPIEREDIVLLAKKIDDIIDCIDETVIDFNIFNIITIREDIKQFVELMNKLCTIEKEMMIKFKSSKKYDEVNKLVIEVNNLEEEGDRLYEMSIRKLFKESDTIEMIKWEKIYTSLENCFDSFESVADTLSEVVLKNS
ncbi:MAG: DUF47 family protein [Clostridia bacterium]|nr:DUF47 family protein [Clostridia bacterium]